MNLGREFVDSRAWFAIQVSDDAHHGAARQVFPVILERCRSLVTSNLVIGETYTPRFLMIDHGIDLIDVEALM